MSSTSRLAEPTIRGWSYSGVSSPGARAGFKKVWASFYVPLGRSFRVVESSKSSRACSCSAFRAQECDSRAKSKRMAAGQDAPRQAKLVAPVSESTSVPPLSSGSRTLFDWLVTCPKWCPLSRSRSLYTEYTRKAWQRNAKRRPLLTSKTGRYASRSAMTSPVHSSRLSSSSSPAPAATQLVRPAGPKPDPPSSVKRRPTRTAKSSPSRRSASAFTRKVRVLVALSLPSR